jgi:hypothetical protein
MSNTRFNKGDTVYDLHGRQGAYIASYGGYHLVAPEYDAGDYGEPTWGTPEQWDQIFIKPPTQKLETKIDELDKLITEKRDELKRINEELDQAGRRRQEQLKKLKQHQALQRIEDYLDGKFTHFLEVPEYYPPKIVAVDDALKRGGIDRWDTPLKLLTLFGDTKGDLQWRINRYSDGSGSSNVEVYPVENEEEAIAIVRRLYAEAVEDWRIQEKKHYGRAIYWTDKCPDGWIEAPDDLRAYLNAAAVERRQADLIKAKEALAKAQAELAALQ